MKSNEIGLNWVILYQMRSIDITKDEICSDQTRLDDINWYQMKSDHIGWDHIGWDHIRKDKIGSDWIKLD